MEASGTSGEKAGINDVINLSVLDGWWGEGYQGDNGWAITPHGQEFDPDYRNQEEAKDLLDIIENEVIPTYYERNGRGYSEQWVRLSKASMRSIIPNYNSQRMVMDYVNKFYARANAQAKRLGADNNRPAIELARWKAKVDKAWPNVKLRRTDESGAKILAGDFLPIRVSANLAELDPEDVIVECVIGTQDVNADFFPREHHIFQAAGRNDQGETLFNLDLKPSLSGHQFYKLRMYPFNRLLAHRFEAGYMLWL